MIATTHIALVVCLSKTDPRLIAWARLLAKKFQAVVTISGEDDWETFVLTKDHSEPLSKSARPKRVSAAFIHASDDATRVQSILECLEGDFKRFVFSSPGVESAESPSIPIVQKTNPWWLREQDATELFDYTVGTRTDLPACCKPESFSFLCALGILCQGYLIAKARLDLLGVEGSQIKHCCSLAKDAAVKVTDSRWWLTPFDGFDLQDEIRKECPEQSVPAEIQSLLDSLGSDDDNRVAVALKKIEAVLNH